MTMPPILVTGGTGTLGQQVVQRLRQAGRDVRVLSRHSRGPLFVTGDLATGAGLPAAAQGAGTIVHCASARKGDAAAARNLVQAVARVRTEAEPPHLVYISIVGVDRFPHGYYKSKLEAEVVIAGSGLPWTTLRATQFYELIHRGRRSAREASGHTGPGRFRGPAGRLRRGSGAARRACPGRAARPGARHGGPGGAQLRRSDPHLSAGHRSAAAAGSAGLDSGHRPHPGWGDVSIAGVRGHPGSPDLAGIPGRPQRVSHVKSRSAAPALRRAGHRSLPTRTSA